MTILRFDDAPVFDLSGVRIRVLSSSMPVGTILIRVDGERVAAPWGA